MGQAILTNVDFGWYKTVARCSTKFFYQKINIFFNKNLRLTSLSSTLYRRIVGVCKWLEKVWTSSTSLLQPCMVKRIGKCWQNWSLFICLVKNLTLTHLKTTLTDFLVKTQYLSLYKNPILLIERKKNVFFGFTDLYVDEL